MKKFFSVIISTLNEEKNLPILLTDLANQTLKDFEIIHVDAESEDQTVRIAQSFLNRLLIKSIHSKKRNICFQRNLGSKSAIGEWLLFMDADIRFSKTFLEECQKQIYNRKFDIFVTFYDPDIKKLSYILLTSFANFLTFASQLSSFPFVTEALFGVRKEVFEKLNGFDEEIKVSEGTVLVNTAKKQKYAYTVLTKPRYQNSMRRAEKFGLSKVLKNNFILATKILTGKKMTAENVKGLYKMEGGSNYKNNS